MTDRHGRAVLADTDVKHGLNVLDFIDQHAVDRGGSLGVNVLLDRVTLGELLEIL
jgi:hypothetical protein